MTIGGCALALFRNPIVLWATSSGCKCAAFVPWTLDTRYFSV